MDQSHFHVFLQMGEEEEGGLQNLSKEDLFPYVQQVNEPIHTAILITTNASSSNIYFMSFNTSIARNCQIIKQIVESLAKSCNKYQ